MGRRRGVRIGLGLPEAGPPTSLDDRGRHLLESVFQMVDAVSEFEQRLGGCRIGEQNRLLRFTVNPIDEFCRNTSVGIRASRLRATRESG